VVSRDRLLLTLHRIHYVRIGEFYRDHEALKQLEEIIQSGPILPGLRGVYWIVRDVEDISKLQRTISGTTTAISLSWLKNAPTFGEKPNHAPWQLLTQTLECIIEKVQALAYFRLSHSFGAPPLDQVSPHLVQLASHRLSNLYLDLGAAEMNSPIMHHIIRLRGLQELHVTQQVGAECDNRGWSLELQATSFGLHDIAHASLSDTSQQIVTTLRQLLWDLKVITRIKALALTIDPNGADTAIETWTAIWHECGTILDTAKLSLDVESVEIVDHTRLAGFHHLDTPIWSSLLTALSVLPHLLSVDYTCTLQSSMLGDLARPYVTTADIWRAGTIWPHLKHFGIDATLVAVLDGELQPTPSLDTIVGCLPPSLESIRFAAGRLEGRVITFQHRHLNLKRVTISPGMLLWDYDGGQDTGGETDLRRLQSLDEITPIRLVDYLTWALPSIEKLNISNWSVSEVEQASSGIQKIARAIDRCQHLDRLARTGSHNLVEGDVLFKISDDDDDKDHSVNGKPSICIVRLGNDYTWPLDHSHEHS
jgi:hypothetical protein